MSRTRNQHKTTHSLLLTHYSLTHSLTTTHPSPLVVADLLLRLDDVHVVGELVHCSSLFVLAACGVPGVGTKFVRFNDRMLACGSYSSTARNRPPAPRAIAHNDTDTAPPTLPRSKKGSQENSKTLNNNSPMSSTVSR